MGSHPSRCQVRRLVTFHTVELIALVLLRTSFMKNYFIIVRTIHVAVFCNELCYYLFLPLPVLLYAVFFRFNMCK